MVMEADFEFLVTNPQAVGQPERNALLLRFELFQQSPDGLQQSGRFVHLSLTPQNAMRLLAILQAVQGAMKLPAEPTPPTRIDVPPEKDRH